MVTYNIPVDPLFLISLNIDTVDGAILVAPRATRAYGNMVFSVSKTAKCDTAGTAFRFDVTTVYDVNKSWTCLCWEPPLICDRKMHLVYRVSKNRPGGTSLRPCSFASSRRRSSCRSRAVPHGAVHMSQRLPMTVGRVVLLGWYGTPVKFRSEEDDAWAWGLFETYHSAPPPFAFV